MICTRNCVGKHGNDMIPVLSMLLFPPSDSWKANLNDPGGHIHRSVNIGLPAWNHSAQQIDPEDSRINEAADLGR